MSITSTISFKEINDSANMVYDTTSLDEKKNLVQQFNSMTMFGKTILALETDSEIIRNMAQWVGCSAEPGAQSLAKIMNDRANELNQQLYEANKPDVSILFDSEKQNSEERTMRR